MNRSRVFLPMLPALLICQGWFGTEWLGVRSAAGSIFGERWAPLPANVPWEMARHDAIYDSLEQRMLVYRGFWDSRLLWSFDLVTEEWTPIANYGASPWTIDWGGHSMIYDGQRHRMVLFGGQNWFALGRLWVVDLSSMQWFEIERTEPWPHARSAHTAVYDPTGDRMILFGGGDEGNGSIWNDVWELDLATYVWTELQPQGALPQARAGHSAIFDVEQHAMIVFGGSTSIEGTTQDDVRLNDTWVLDLNTLTWTEAPPWGLLPPSRASHSAIYLRDSRQMLVYGGSLLSDLWAFDLEHLSWTELTPGGEIPPGRGGHSAIYDEPRHRMVVWAGSFGGGGGGPQDDMWELDLNAVTWSELVPSNVLPPGMNYPGAASDTAGNRLFVFSGDPEDGLYSLDYTTLTWEHVPSAGTPPPARERPFLVYDPPHDRIVLYGGFGMNDLWALDLTSLTWSELLATGTGPIPHGVVYDEAVGQMIVYGGGGASLSTVDLSTLEWNALQTTGQVPPNREWYSLITDSRRHRLVLYGGEGWGYYGDAYTLDLDSFVWRRHVAQSSSPGPRKGHATVYDAARDRMVMYGGYYGAGFGTTFADTWQLDLASMYWTQIHPDYHPRSLRYHCAAYDPNGGRMFVFGGNAGNWSGRDGYYVTLSPGLDLTLTPEEPPIIIPPEGGSFACEATIENRLDEAVRFFGVAVVRLPTGLVVPVDSTDSMVLQPGAIVSSSLTFEVPPEAPPGEYEFQGYLGKLPPVIILDRDDFSFTKEE